VSLLLLEELSLSRLLEEPRLDAPEPLGSVELPDGLLEPLREEPLPSEPEPELDEPLPGAVPDEPLPSELPEPEELLPAPEGLRPLPEEPLPRESELPGAVPDEPLPSELPEPEELLPAPEGLRPLLEGPLPSEPEPELEEPAPEPMSLDEELLLLPLLPELEVVPELPIDADDIEMPRALAVSLSS
jgi:hypothetical protein